MPTSSPGPLVAGVGWRHAHERDLLEGLPRLPFIEVHSENFFAAGGASLALLEQARSHYDVSLHGVGLALGSAAGLDPWHLDRLAALAERVQPLRISDHASFARAPLVDRLAAGPATVHAADLLPIAFNAASLDILAANVGRVQDRLGRPIGIENLSAYLGWGDDTLAEPDFLNRLAARSGCWLLLDLNNLFVNALNASSADPLATACAFVDAIEPRHVGQIHLAGFDDRGTPAIDHHGSRVDARVWQVYAHALLRWGARPTLIEWDTDLPAFDVLLDEAAQAERLAAAAPRSSAP